MARCAVLNCKGQHKKGYSLYRIPVSPTRRAKWLKFCRRKDWAYTDKSKLGEYRVCEVHFEQSQFEAYSLKEGNKPKLRKTSVPTIFEVPKYQKGFKFKRRIVKSNRPILEIKPPVDRKTYCLRHDHSYFKKPEILEAQVDPRIFEPIIDIKEEPLWFDQPASVREPIDVKTEAPCDADDAEHGGRLQTIPEVPPTPDLPVAVVRLVRCDDPHLSRSDAGRKSSQDRDPIYCNPWYKAIAVRGKLVSRDKSPPSGSVAKAPKPSTLEAPIGLSRRKVKRRKSSSKCRSASTTAAAVLEEDTYTQVEYLEEERSHGHKKERPSNNDDGTTRISTETLDTVLEVLLKASEVLVPPPPPQADMNDQFGCLVATTLKRLNTRTAAKLRLKFMEDLYKAELEEM